MSRPKRSTSAVNYRAPSDSDEEEMAQQPVSESDASRSEGEDTPAARAAPAASSSKPAVKRQRKPRAASQEDNDDDDPATDKAPKLPRQKPVPVEQRYSSIRHWLMKNEPPFSLAALQTLPNQTEPWVGVRNKEAGGMMVHGMKVGHQVLYYNASIANPHIAGIARVCSAPYADPTAFDPASPYHDAKSVPDQPTWHLVDVQYERTFARPVYLAELRHYAETDEHAPVFTKDFSLFRKFRLSIHPLSAEMFDFLVKCSERPLPDQVKLKKERSSGDHPSRKRKKASGEEEKEGEQQEEAAAKTNAVSSEASSKQTKPKKKGHTQKESTATGAADDAPSAESTANSSLSEASAAKKPKKTKSQ
jgi:predicted RNA-binding protein with PUA-like domain